MNSYRNEITAFLTSHNYRLKEYRKPNKDDWHNSPFEKPSRFGLGFSFKVLGIDTNWTNTNYFVIIGETDFHERRIWLEVKTTYFKKPEMKFTFE